MYTDWFKLDTLPFRLRPDPDFLCLSGKSAAQLADLRQSLANSRGIILLAGEAGLGKTTLLRVLERDCTGKAGLACIYQPDLTEGEMLVSLALQFGLPESPDEAPLATAQRLREFLAHESAEGRVAVVLVDNAQHLPDATLHALLSLGRLAQPPLIVLAGTKGMLRKVRREAGPDARRIVLLPLLDRMELEDLRKYILHRLATAGGTDETLFDPTSFQQILRYTGGVPRLVNVLCDRALILAELRGFKSISAQHISDTALDLGWQEFRNQPDELDGETQTGPPWETNVQSIASGTGHDRNLELVVQFRGEPVTRLRLKPGRTVIGRGDDADLQLHSNVISRHHCQIVTTHEGSIIEDLGSTNGLVINGRRMRVHRLAESDRIQVGHHEITCRIARDGDLSS